MKNNNLAVIFDEIDFLDNGGVAQMMQPLVEKYGEPLIVPCDITGTQYGKFNTDQGSIFFVHEGWWTFSEKQANEKFGTNQIAYNASKVTSL